MSVATPAAESQVLSRAASASWRTWLMTGLRQAPIVRRRVRGAHKGLKRMLVEGMEAGDRPDNWRSFSGAMVRQAVDQAVSDLPPRQKQLIKLAYFSDLTNREIARGLGITVSSVERSLREAIARVSQHVERGRQAGRKAIYGIAAFVTGRWLDDVHRAVRAGTLVLVTASAGAVLSAQPAAPAQIPNVPRVQGGSSPAPVSAPTDELARSSAIQGPTAAGGAMPSVPGPASVPSVSAVLAAVPLVVAPVATLPIAANLPALPATSTVHGLLGA
jgi:RNA polymerase sigma-70 factor (ECF subfamily)